MSRNELVAALRERARLMYEGKVVAHRSCAIAIAQTFGRDHRPYQALRRGGVTGEGECGAVIAGRMVLGELFGDPEPTGPVTPALKEALTRYFGAIRTRLPRGDAPSLVCNDLVRRFPEFMSPERARYCTDLAATVAEIVAEIAVDLGAEVRPPPPL
jgi:hypothetical protein